jgi:hypothetical protein
VAGSPPALDEPVLLVAGGCLLGLTPGFRTMVLPPPVDLLLFSPPLLYWESLTTSLREIRTNLRGIVLLATGLVLATAAAVAGVGHALGPLLAARLHPQQRPVRSGGHPDIRHRERRALDDQRDQGDGHGGEDDKAMSCERPTRGRGGPRAAASDTAPRTPLQATGNLSRAPERSVRWTGRRSTARRR